MRKETTLEYGTYLQKIIDLSGKVKRVNAVAEYPTSLATAAQRDLYDNLGKNEALTNELDDSIMRTKKDGWRDNAQKSKAVRLALTNVLAKHSITEEQEIHRIFDIVKNQRDY